MDWILWLFCLVCGHEWDTWWTSMYDDFAFRHRDCHRCHEHEVEFLSKREAAE